jgi:hypothetical protein
MHADFSVELGRDDPALDLPWHSDDPHVRYFDLKSNPELIQLIPEAVAYPPLGAFLVRINAAEFPMATAKCDAWHSREVTAEEEIFGDRKFVSYIDLVFVDEADQCSFEKHEAFVRELCRLLGHAPEIAAMVELVIRRCYYHREERDGVRGRIGAGATEAGDAERAVDAAGAAKAVGVEKIVGAVAENPVDAAKGVDARGSAKEDGTAGAARMRCFADKQRSGTEAVTESAMRGAEENATFRQDKRDAERMDERSQADEAELNESSADEGSGGEGASFEESGVDGGRRWSDADASVSGFYVTAYVSGFGDEEHEPRGGWEVALTLLQNALVQLARSGPWE